METNKESNLLWVFGGLAGIVIVFLFLTDTKLSLLTAESERPTPGKVFRLDGDNLAKVKHQVPLLVALYTGGGVSGERMARSLDGLAKDYKDTAIIGVGPADKDGALRTRAKLEQLPAYIIYRDGEEIHRATGENADISIRRRIAEATGKQ